MCLLPCTDIPFSQRHHIFTLSLGNKLYLAPISSSGPPQRALDVGTGTGIWAIDFADQHPNCQVIGTDLSPIQPGEVPPNLQFEIDDCCSEWVYTKESFDFIHVRCMYGSIADWPAFYNECMKHLKPGGWIEQVELSVEPKADDDTVPPDSIFAKWGKVSLEAGDAFGKTLRCVDESRQGIINAGFEAVQEHRFKLPIGPWSKDKRLKEIGLYNYHHWSQGIEGWCMFLLTNYLRWSVQEVQVYVAQMRSMLNNRSVHAYHDASCVYGRKPLRADGAGNISSSSDDTVRA